MNMQIKIWMTHTLNQIMLNMFRWSNQCKRTLMEYTTKPPPDPPGVGSKLEPPPDGPPGVGPKVGRKTFHQGNAKRE